MWCNRTKKWKKFQKKKKKRQLKFGNAQKFHLKGEILCNFFLKKYGKTSKKVDFLCNGEKYTLDFFGGGCYNRIR